MFADRVFHHDIAAGDGGGDSVRARLLAVGNNGEFAADAVRPRRQ